MINDKLRARFFSAFTVAETGCWEWNLFKTPKGYGTLRISLKAKMKAHRLSWLIHHGQIPEGKLVCHHCDNPPCVNPEHLFIGTHADNMQDMRKKGRRKCVKRGPSRHKRYLGIIGDKAAEAREMVASGLKMRVVAARFGVSISAIHYLAVHPFFGPPIKVKVGRPSSRKSEHR